MIEPINTVLTQFWRKLAIFLPDFFIGILVLFVGLIAASILKKIIISLFNFFKIDFIISKSKLLQKGEIKIWEQIIAEIIRWTVIILFLIPTLEIWGLSKATQVLNQFLFYTPNVIIAVIVLFVGIVVANLVADLVRHSIASFSSKSAVTVSFIAKSTVLFFTFLIVLNQLGVAQDLIRILFTGIVAMLAIAGGLAFGLGGKDLARELLDELKKSLQK